jgi:hypothetical protein
MIGKKAPAPSKEKVVNKGGQSYLLFMSGKHHIPNIVENIQSLRLIKSESGKVLKKNTNHYIMLDFK